MEGTFFSPGFFDEDDEDDEAVWVSNHAALAMTVPFGDPKWSGVGVGNGLVGLLEYTEQALYVSKK